MRNEGIQQRIMETNRFIYGLQRGLRLKLLTRRTKNQIYKILIRPVLIYRCESCKMRKSDEQQLLVFDRKVFRFIFGAMNEGVIFGGMREGDRWRLHGSKHCGDSQNAKADVGRSPSL